MNHERILWPLPDPYKATSPALEFLLAKRERRPYAFAFSVSPRQSFDFKALGHCDKPFAQEALA